MKQILFSLFTLITFCSLSQYENPIVFGHTDTIVSATMGATERINIYLPPEYNPDSAATYPVIYLLDGALDEDFFHMAGLIQFSSFWWVNYLPPTIVIGIVSTDRKRDLTYCPASTFTWPDWMHAYSEEVYRYSGHSANFMQYIEQDLIPYVESHYKCSGKRTLIGQSLAGLFATEVLLKKPSLFNDYIIMSPSLWWGNESLLKDAPELLKALPESPKKIYIAVGNEGKVMVREAKTLANLIKKAGVDNVQLFYEYLPKEDHGTILHQATGNAFELMYAMPKEF